MPPANRHRRSMTRLSFNLIIFLYIFGLEVPTAKVYIIAQNCHNKLYILITNQYKLHNNLLL